MDAAVDAVLPELDGVFTLKEEEKNNFLSQVKMLHSRLTLARVQ